jgi:hypothetical protein
MKNNFKYISLAIAAVICISIYVYFSPYHSCARDLKNFYEGERLTALINGHCSKARY